MKYWVSITKQLPLRELRSCVFSGFIDSDMQTAEEVKQSILEKGAKGLRVTVIESAGIDKFSRRRK